MNVEIYKNLLPTEVNKRILSILVNHHWHLGVDNHINQRLENALINRTRGFSVQTYEKGNYTEDTILNPYGFIIFDMITSKLKFKTKLDRLYWNMYFPGQETDKHIDSDFDNSYSALYNLNTTDGGILIDDQFYKDEESELKIFKSKTPHQGIGPKTNTIRFNLNITFLKDEL
jgi:hypothetical protein|tara:strand:+ start:1986 stop:2504 length:519 start_codon:yes stop_codon:yes gene_type:complete